VPRALLVSLALLVLPGCLRIRETIVLAADGSGTLRWEHEFDLGALRALVVRARAALGLPPGEGDLASGVNPVDGAWLRALAKPVKDVTLASVETKALPDGRLQTVAEGRFPSLQKAAEAGAFLGADVALERAPKDVWRLVVRDPWTPLGPGSSTVFGGLEATFVRERFGADLKALSRSLRVTFPVPVRLTNGRVAEDLRTVTWSAPADAATPAALIVEFILPADTAWATFRRRPDLAQLTRRCLLPPPQSLPQASGLGAPAPPQPVATEGR
jgi:hypothetical protein